MTEEAAGASIGRVAALCGVAFFLLASYAIARPAVESMFLEVHSAEALPRAWIVVAVVAVLVTALYNGVAGRQPLVRVFGLSALASGAVLAGLLAARGAGVWGSTFALYIWKDVYVVVLIECFWTMANSMFAVKSARWIYGLFCVAGSLGGMTGNLGVGVVASSIGTASSLWLVLPALLLAVLPTLALDAGAAAPGRQRGGSAAGGLAVLRESRYLVLMLCLIATVQVIITLVDYQFNVMVERAYPDEDARTAVIGQVYAATDAGSLTLQLLTGVILRLAGVPLALLAIPVIIGATLAAFAVTPRLLTMAVAKVAGKVFDYSLFRAAKEILYIPLGYREKTQGKAFVDIMTYRVAKGGASLLLLALAGLNALPLITGLTLALAVLWFTLTLAVTRRYRHRRSIVGASAVS